MLCIAYANEMSDACISHGIDPYEVSAVAATKPFGYMPYTPGLGVGGPCIPVNPYYLFLNNRFPLLQLATETMERRPASIASRLMAKLKNPANPPRILVVGVGFKRGQSLLSHSPGVALIKALQENWEVEVNFADPLVDQASLPFARRLNQRTEWNEEYLGSFNLIIIAVKQIGLDLDLLDNVEVPIEQFAP